MGVSPGPQTPKVGSDSGDLLILGVVAENQDLDNPCHGQSGTSTALGADPFTRSRDAICPARASRLNQGAMGMFRSVLVAVAVTAVSVMPAQAETVSGRVTNPKAGMDVIVIGNDGTSRSAAVKPNGRFRITGPRQIMRRIFPRTGTGPTLHLLRDDTYLGPVLLASKSQRAGYTRLRAKAPKKIMLGTMTVRKQGFVSVKKLSGPKVTRQNLAKKGVDTSTTVRMRKGVPLGAGSQGATGRLAATAEARGLAGSSMPAGQNGLGADGDADGVPNVADVDMNGDQILDAAQLARPELTTSGQPFDGGEVLANRPAKVATVQKFLDTSSLAAVNSNVNADVTWDELITYLNSTLKISTSVPSNVLQDLFCPGLTSPGPEVPVCPPVQELSSVEVNCQLLYYCSPGSQAVLRLPDPALDGKLLRDTLLPNGAFSLFSSSSGPSGSQRSFSTTFEVRSITRDNVLLTGDSFEFVFKDGSGAEMGRQVSVLTSSVASPPEFSAVAGQPVVAPFDSAQPVKLTGDQSRSLTLEFFRPQTLDGDQLGASAPVLTDRGGLEYAVTVFALRNDPGASGYFCSADQVLPLSEDLVALESTIGPTGTRNGRLYDRNTGPTNGSVLRLQLNLGDCLAQPASGPGGPSPEGTTLAIDLGSFDSDDNRTSSRVFVKP